MSVFKESLLQAQSLLWELRMNDETVATCEDIVSLMVSTIKARRKIFICGNGGSHADALHFAEELTGKSRNERAPIGAIALGEATHASCVGNDFGFDYVFSRQLLGLANPGDLLVLLSTSGKSNNLFKAAVAAKEAKVNTVALLGRTGGVLKALVDKYVIVPGDTSDRIQELHMLLLHIIVERIEQELKC